MKRRILLVVAVLLIVAGLSIFAKVLASILAPRGHGGLQITSNVSAEVFLNGKPQGATPVCLCDSDKTLSAGDYDVRITPKDSSLAPFSAKVTVNPNVLTALDKTFLPGALSSSYILTLEKTNEKDGSVFIASIPDGALVTLDGQSEGVTPLTLKSISASEHEVEIEKLGFAKKTVRIRTVDGYKLILNTILGTATDEKIIKSPTPTNAPETTLTPTSPPSKIFILSTPNGFLRVREEPALTAAEIGRVNSGESFDATDENDSWFKIKLDDGSEGWVSKSYAEKRPIQ